MVACDKVLLQVLDAQKLPNLQNKVINGYRVWLRLESCLRVSAIWRRLKLVTNLLYIPCEGTRWRRGDHLPRPDRVPCPTEGNELLVFPFPASRGSTVMCATLMENAGELDLAVSNTPKHKHTQNYISIQSVYL